jgi:peptidoglycan/xylan/chitin deacetylase (PgdA/CDA1 family)
MFDEAKPILETLFEEQIGSEKEWGEKLYLSDTDLAKMEKVGMNIGGHGANHRWMSSLTTEEQTKEIETSANRLKKLNSGPWAFSYPYGDYNDFTPEFLQKNNFISAFTIKEKTDHDNFFTVGRFDTNSIKLQ